jgi:hypothetical protein
MKNRVRIIVALTTFLMMAGWTIVQAQPKIDTERMDRDIEIAENALSTLIKQQFDRRQTWFEVKANYTPGYGVTMRLPSDNSSWIYESYNVKGRAVIAPMPAMEPMPAGVGSVVIVNGSNDNRDNKDNDKNKSVREASRDSARAVYYTKMIQASKDFIADYGDLLSQLQPNEKILITNRGDGRYHYYDLNKSQKRQLVTIEGNKAAMTAFRQGKITREQMLASIKVVNTETTNEVETDLELLSSILGRLYRSDLSKTFYTDENVYYERLKNFGVIYYMSAYSGVEQNRRGDEQAKGKLWTMPTQRLEGLTQEQRDKKVIELFPQFEKELKENIVEYGQTVKSLGDNEMFVFNIQLTKCVGCNIPATLEISIPAPVIKGVASGKVPKADAVASMSVKRGPNQ